MSAPRPSIPSQIEREVRQRCGFGCVLCGLPLYEYHHIDEDPKNNVATNITLLCDIHHKEATNRLLTREQIISADKQPCNPKCGVSAPYGGLHFEGQNFGCAIGSNWFSSQLRNNEDEIIAIAISVDDVDLLGFRVDRSGALFLNATILDENNLPLLKIQDNWLMYRTDSWDIKFIRNRLTVHEAARKILFEIEFRPPGDVVIERARLLCNGVEILVRKSHVFVVNSESLLVGSRAVGGVGLQLGRNLRGFPAVISCNPELLGRYHMPSSEVLRREREALERMNRLGVMIGDPT